MEYNSDTPYFLGLQGTSSTSEESRKRAIRLESNNIRQKHSAESIFHAAMMTQEEPGYHSAHKIHKMLLDNPELGDKLIGFIDKPPPPSPEKMPKVNSLSLLIHHDMSKHDYNIVKQKSSKCNADFLHCYDYILAEKIFCRPPKETYFISEIEASIPLKAIVVHTIDRILQIPKVNKPILELKDTGVDATLKLFGKVGEDT